MSSFEVEMLEEKSARIGSAYITGRNGLIEPLAATTRLQIQQMRHEQLASAAPAKGFLIEILGWTILVGEDNIP